MGEKRLINCDKRIISKNGLGHVEAIITFIIFIGFLLFAFYFFNPLRGQRTLDTTLDYALIEIQQFSEVQTESYHVSLISPVALPLTVTLNIPGASLWNVSVQNSSGFILPSTFDQIGGVTFTRSALTDSFIELTFGKNFKKNTPSLTPVTPLTSGQFSIASTGKEKILSEDKLLSLHQNYTASYLSLKTQFNLPNRVDFGFNVKFDDGSEIKGTYPIPQDVEVTSQTDRVKVIRSSDNRVEFAELRVFVW